MAGVFVESQRVEVVERRATVTGQLTLHGVTREIVVPVDVQFSQGALVATGEFQLNRRDYAINYSSFLNPSATCPRDLHVPRPGVLR